MASTFAKLAIEPIRVETDSHTFARPGDEAALRDAVLAALERHPGHPCGPRRSSLE